MGGTGKMGDTITTIIKMNDKAETRRTLDEAVALVEEVIRESVRRRGNTDEASTLDTGVHHG